MHAGFTIPVEKRQEFPDSPPYNFIWHLNGGRPACGKKGRRQERVVLGGGDDGVCVGGPERVNKAGSHPKHTRVVSLCVAEGEMINNLLTTTTTYFLIDVVKIRARRNLWEAALLKNFLPVRDLWGRSGERATPNFLFFLPPTLISSPPNLFSITFPPKFDASSQESFSSCFSLPSSSISVASNRRARTSGEIWAITDWHRFGANFRPTPTLPPSAAIVQSIVVGSSRRAFQGKWALARVMGTSSTTPLSLLWLKNWWLAASIEV